MKMKFITEAWKDRKMNELFELSNYTDEMGWVSQSIDRIAARKFICQFLSELPDETKELKKKISELEEEIELLKEVTANPGGMV